MLMKIDCWYFIMETLEDISANDNRLFLFFNLLEGFCATKSTSFYFLVDF